MNTVITESGGRGPKRGEPGSEGRKKSPETPLAQRREQGAPKGGKKVRGILKRKAWDIQEEWGTEKTGRQGHFTAST